jgi:hypothetical protein
MFFTRKLIHVWTSCNTSIVCHIHSFFFVTVNAYICYGTSFVVQRKLDHLKFHEQLPWADPGFQVRGEHLKKLLRAEGGAKIFGVFRVKNHDFTPKNHIFSNFRGSRPGRAPRILPWLCQELIADFRNKNYQQARVRDQHMQLPRITERHFPE